MLLPSDQLSFNITTEPNPCAPAQVTATVQRRGFFPKGGGGITLTARTLPPGLGFSPLTMEQRGEVVALDVFAFSAGRVASQVRRVTRLAWGVMRRAARCSTPPSRNAEFRGGHTFLETSTHAFSIFSYISNGCLHVRSAAAVPVLPGGGAWPFRPFSLSFRGSFAEN